MEAQTLPADTGVVMVDQAGDTGIPVVTEGAMDSRANF